MPEISSKELFDIQAQLAVIQVTGENTLLECRKTNGRVTKLEDSHNSIKTDIAVLGEKYRVLDRDLDDITPEIRKSSSLLDMMKGNWQAIMIVFMVIAWTIDKFLK